MSEPILELRGLRLAIKTDEGLAKILDHIDFAVDRGRILGLVGESGCGKSTIIRAIIGILPPGAEVEAGVIRFEGEDLLGLSEQDLNRRIRGSRIGFIPQDPYLALNPVFKVGTQLLEIMRWHAPDEGVRHGERNWRNRARIVELLRRVQLPDPEGALERFPHQFSGGQRQRLVIAAALASSPALVIADEPTTALDVTTQQQIIDLLRDLVGEFGLSMLFVTHDLGVVAQLCDDLCVIYAGQTVESGRTVAVLDQPRHPYTRALLACHPDRATAFTCIRRSSVAVACRTGVPLCAALRRGSVWLRSAPPPSGRRPNGKAGRLRAVRAGRNRRRMSELPAILELRDLHVSLGGRREWLRKAVPPVHAVAGVSFSVRQGEILGLVGESGCGKTTLGRAVLGLQRETSGEIYLDGRLLTGASPKRARVERNDIHYVHQDAAAALDPWWSIGRTLEEGLIIHGLRKANERRARVREMLAAVGLDESVLPRYPHELSGGQLRRVTLARILVLQPRFIIFDEPTSGLDMSVQAMVLNLLLELRGRLGLTYLFISHDLSVVERFCDRVAIMYLGRIVEAAPTGKIFASPRHPYTRELLAAIPRLMPEPKRAGRLVQGEPPIATCLPAGCTFANRCPHVEPACISTEPALENVLDHQVACRRWQEFRSDARAA